MSDPMQGPDQETGLTSGRPHRARWVLLAVAVVALVLGGLGGWSIASLTHDDKMTDEDLRVASDVVTVGNSPLTDRQQEMVQLTKQYVAAFKANDAAAVTSFFAPEGKLESILYDDEFLASDGTITERTRAAMAAFDMSSLEPVGPLLVDGNMVYAVAATAQNQFSSLLVFTDTGDVQILRHISLNS